MVDNFQVDFFQVILGGGWQFRSLVESEITPELYRTHGCEERIGNCQTNILPIELVLEQAELEDNTMLKTNPYFLSFLNEDILSPDESTGSAAALVEHPRVLSFAIPSLSFAAGGTKISKPSVLKELNKVDMNDRFITNGWPDDHKDPEGNEAWFHSDFKDVSYLYTFGLFNDMVGRANLK